MLLGLGHQLIIFVAEAIRTYFCYPTLSCQLCWSGSLASLYRCHRSGHRRTHRLRPSSSLLSPLRRQHWLLTRSAPHQRWLTAAEALLLQGIPTTSRLTGGVVVNSFSKPDREPFLLTSRSVVIGQAGNTMHATAVGLAILFAIDQVRRLDEPLLGLRTLNRRPSQ
jgi:hypothetical protein